MPFARLYFAQTDKRNIPLCVAYRNWNDDNKRLLFTTKRFHHLMGIRHGFSNVATQSVGYVTLTRAIHLKKPTYTLEHVSGHTQFMATTDCEKAVLYFSELIKILHQSEIGSKSVIYHRIWHSNIISNITFATNGKSQSCGNGSGRKRARQTPYFRHYTLASVPYKHTRAPQ